MRMSRRASVLGASQAVALSTLAVGTEIMLNESGSPITFIVIAHGYPAANRTLLMRKEVYNYYPTWGTSNYIYSTPYTWCNGTYLGYLDASVQALLANVTVYYRPYNGDNTSVSTKIYTLSFAELGVPYTEDEGEYGAIIEGTAIPYFDSNAKRIAYLSGVAKAYWTRTQAMPTQGARGYVTTDGSVSPHMWSSSTSSTYYVRPVLTLPYTTKAYGSTYLIY